MHTHVQSTNLMYSCTLTVHSTQSPYGHVLTSAANNLFHGGSHVICQAVHYWLAAKDSYRVLLTRPIRIHSSQVNC